MPFLLLAAFILALIGIATAAGTHFVTTWPVWLCAAIAAYFLYLLLGAMWAWYTPHRTRPPA